MDIPAHKQSFPRRSARTAAGFFKSEYGPSNGSVLDFASTACHDPLADQIQSSFQSETSIYFILFIYLFIYLWITQQEIEFLVEGFSIRAGVEKENIIINFLLYINDVTTAVPSAEVNLFADDTSAFVISKDSSDLKQHLQVAADQLSSWFDKWLLSINIEKSVIMLIKSPRASSSSVEVTISRQGPPTSLFTQAHWPGF